MPSSPDPALFRAFQRTPRVTWVGVASLVLVACGLLWTARGAGVEAAQRAFEAELLACQRRVATGYITSGIRISEDDASTIQAACQQAVQERLHPPTAR